MNLGNNIKKARQETGKTTKEAAQKIGIAKMTYQHYEGGKREPSAQMLKKIAEGLGTTADALLEMGKVGGRQLDYYEKQFLDGLGQLDAEGKQLLCSLMKKLTQ